MKYSITGTVRNNTIVETAASKAPQDVCAIKKQGYLIISSLTKVLTQGGMLGNVLNEIRSE